MPQQDKKGDSRPGRARRRRGRRKPKQAPENSAVEALKNDSRIDSNKPAEVPLSEAEAKEMREHFSFLARYRKVLRLKLNAQEDLLLNGAKAPEHRGVCMHLLHKIDRSAIKAALSRLDDAEARVRLLEGIVRFSSDIAVVILFLESLSAASSREQAAAALTVALRRLDFEKVSSAQMRRLLDLIIELFEAEQRPALLFDLLAQRSFRETFDQALDDLPADIAESVTPLRAIWGSMRNKRSGKTSQEDVLRGARLLLSAPAATLRSYPRPMREALFEQGLAMAAAERPPGALDAMLESFDPQSRTASSLAMAWAQRLLAEHDDRRARTWLERLVKHHPSFNLPKNYLSALDSPAVGRIALLDGTQTDAGDEFRRGLWLDEQRNVWVRLGPADAAPKWNAESVMHERLVLPGLAPALAQGFDDSGAPYIAVAAVGRPAPAVLRSRGGPGHDRLALAREAVVLLGGLCLARQALPDARLERFLIDRGGRLWIASLAGAEQCTSQDAASEKSLRPARAIARELLRGGPQSSEMSPLLAQIDEAPDLTALAALLV